MLLLNHRREDRKLAPDGRVKVLEWIPVIHQCGVQVSSVLPRPMPGYPENEIM
jgi:hypothetical protein